MPVNFIIDSDSQIIFTLEQVVGRFRITLDNQDIFDDNGLTTPTLSLVTDLSPGNHKLDFTASDLGQSKYDVKCKVSIQKKTDNSPILKTQFGFKNPGNDPNNKLDGKTLQFTVTGGNP
jgi:hypothetical protein